MIHGFDVIWPYVDELFRDDELTARLAAAGAAVEPSSLRADFDRLTGEVLAEAELEVPQVPFAPRRRTPRPALRTPGLHPRRNAGARPRVPRGHLVAMCRSHDSRRPRTSPGNRTPEQKAWDHRRHGLRSGNPGPHHRGPGDPPRGRLLRRRRNGPRPSGSPSRPPTRAARPWTPFATTSRRRSPREGYPSVHVELVLAPAWTTDWMSAGRQGQAAGVRHRPALSGRAGGGRPSPGRSGCSLAVKCPQCSSLNTKELTRFGSTSCKALYVCQDCKEPFDYFKVL